MRRKRQIAVFMAALLSAPPWPLSTLTAGENSEKGLRTPLDLVEERLAETDDGPFPGSIILGSDAVSGAYLFQVSLISANAKAGQEANGHFCGGSIIGAQWVLTAAHCVTSDDHVASPKQIEVYVGSSNFTNGDRIPVKAIHRHPGYVHEFLDNDVALLQLAREPKSQVARENILIVGMEDETRHLRAGAEAKIVGWGTTERGDFSRTLREASIQIVDRTDCNKNLLHKRGKDIEESLKDIARNFRIDRSGLKQVEESILRNAGPLVTESMFCAGDPTGSRRRERVRDACQGDSGGPIFLKGKDGRFLQIGIISWGEGCGVPNMYGIYTRLAKFADWIARTAKLSH
jgi:secreted trypsin-like serine protease